MVKAISPTPNNAAASYLCNTSREIQLGFDELTLVSPSGARGSVIHEPYLDPDVLIVIESLIPVSFPQAGQHNK